MFKMTTNETFFFCPRGHFHRAYLWYKSSYDM